MKITYIQHSAFLVEWEDVACLFDWAEGELPTTEKNKKLYIFASHAHGDHFTPELYERCRDFPQRTYLLSEDVKPLPGGEESVVRMPAGRRRVIPGGSKGAMTVSTLRSTDQGVAFVVNYAGRTIYHAGDLHWWAWPDDTAEEEQDMKERFFAEIVKLKGVPLDAAFLPLDPRLGGNFWMGFDAFMRSAEVKAAFPMHLWEHYEYIGKLRQMSVSAPYRDKIVEIRESGESFEI